MLQCDALVDVYVPEVIALLATVTPEEVCRLIKYCPGMSLLEDAIPELDGPVEGQVAVMVEADLALGVATPQECAACRFLVSQAKKKLKDPANQVLQFRWACRAECAWFKLYYTLDNIGLADNSGGLFYRPRWQFI